MAAKPLPRAVPRGRLARLARFGSLTARVASSAVFNGAERIVRGQRPRLSELILTPANITRLADQLAHLRGAAMKLGQLLSMDDGGLLPPQLSDLLNRLRDNADPMPVHQLYRVLSGAWGPNWQQRFARFEPQPVAAASIGQVHRAWLHDGRQLAIKVQYPGVADSIDSDVDNVIALLRLSGLLPEDWDLSALVEEAKVQLKQEADYLAEARALGSYCTALGPRDGVCLPSVERALCTDKVLAMSYEPGLPIEHLVRAPQATRDKVVGRLFELLFEELFNLGWMQTDPNLANFRYRADADELVLLDFGACRPIPSGLSGQYRRLLQHGVDGDHQGLALVLNEMQLLSAQATTAQRQALLKLIHLACEPLRQAGGYDFGSSDLSQRLQVQGNHLALDLAYRHVPPPALAFIHRKLGGCYLIAARLSARVDLATRFATANRPAGAVTQNPAGAGPG